MSQGSNYSMLIHMLDNVVGAAIPNQNFDPRDTFRKLSAARLHQMVDVGLSPAMLRDLKEVVIDRIAAGPPDSAELELLLQSLPRD